MLVGKVYYGSRELFLSSQLCSTPRFVGAWDLLTGITVGKVILVNVDLNNNPIILVAVLQ